jgi:hypothetical protein
MLGRPALPRRPPRTSSRQGKMSRDGGGSASGGNGPAVTARIDREHAESIAAELVIAELRERGHAVLVRGRPDQERRNEQAADFLLEVDGEAVALEITDFYPSQADGARRGIGQWFVHQLEVELRQFVEESELGSVTVYVTLPRTPDRRRLGAAVGITAQAILAALPVAGTAVVREDWDANDLFASIRIFRRPDRAPFVEVLHQPHGSYVEPAVRAFLDRSIPTKAAQTASYQHAIVAAFDRSFVSDIETFTIVLRARAEELPSNWDAFYFVTPVGDGGWRARRVWGRDAVA